MVLLPDGRIANTTFYFDYDREINTKQYVDGYEDGEADARRGYSIQVSHSADKNYRDGYYDGYGGFTPVATSLDIGGHKRIKLSTPLSEQPKTWHPVITFSGKNDKTTKPFTIVGDVWRVKYVALRSGSYFHVCVYPKGETMGKVGCFPVNPKIHYCYNDTFYIFEGSNDYYFEVNAANIDSWTLEVEDYY